MLSLQYDNRTYCIHIPLKATLYSPIIKGSASHHQQRPLRTSTQHSVVLLLHSPVVGVLLPADCLVGIGLHVAGPVHHLAQARLHHDHLPGLLTPPADNKPWLEFKVTRKAILNIPPFIIRVDALHWIEFCFDRDADWLLAMGSHGV